MSIPVISTTTSVLGYRRAQQFSFQMQATNSPTSWAASGLPAGMTINNTGLITGAATVAGVYLVRVTATNATGTSAPLSVAMGIEESMINDGIGIGVDIDLITGSVVATGITAAADKPALFLKYRDLVFLDVGFFKGSVLQEMNVVQLKIHIREFDGETILVESSGDLENLGTADKPRYRIALDLNSTTLRDVLGNYEDQFATSFLAIAEFEWRVTYDSSSVLPSELTRSSKTFRIAIDRDLIANE